MKIFNRYIHLYECQLNYLNSIKSEKIIVKIAFYRDNGFGFDNCE